MKPASSHWPEKIVEFSASFLCSRFLCRDTMVRLYFVFCPRVSLPPPFSFLPFSPFLVLGCGCLGWPSLAMGLGGGYRPGGGGSTPSCGGGCAVPGVFVSFVLCVLVGGPGCFVCPFHVPPLVGRMIGGGGVATGRSSAPASGAGLSGDGSHLPPLSSLPSLCCGYVFVSLVVCLSLGVRGFGLLHSWFFPTFLPCAAAIR